jgi:hypothetical protein
LAIQLEPQSGLALERLLAVGWDYQWEPWWEQGLALLSEGQLELESALALERSLAVVWDYQWEQP